MAHNNVPARQRLAGTLCIVRTIEYNEYSVSFAGPHEDRAAASIGAAELRGDCCRTRVHLDAGDLLWRWKQVEIEEPRQDNAVKQHLHAARTGAVSANTAAFTFGERDCACERLRGNTRHIDSPQRTQKVAGFARAPLLDLLLRNELANALVAALVEPQHAHRDARRAHANRIHQIGGSGQDVRQPQRIVGWHLNNARRWCEPDAPHHQQILTGRHLQDSESTAVLGNHASAHSHHRNVRRAEWSEQRVRHDAIYHADTGHRCWLSAGLLGCAIADGGFLLCLHRYDRSRYSRADEAKTGHDPT